MPETCTTAVMAALIGADQRTVRNLADRDILIRAGRNAFDVKASLPRYCKHLRDAASGRLDDTAAAARTRLANARAEVAEAEAGKKAGRLVDVSEFDRRWGDECKTIMAAIISAPTSISIRLPHLTKHEFAEIDTVLRDKLTELADGAERTLAALDAEAAK